MDLIKKHLPTAPNQEQQPTLSDILTDREKDIVIEWAISQKKQHFERTLKGLGALPQQIEEKLKGINWHEQINIGKLLADANERKHWQEETAKDKAIRLQDAQELRQKIIATWNANKFYKSISRHFKAKHGQFVFNDTNKNYITALCFFLSGDPRFQTELNYSFDKGLMIVGTAGLGKTETIKAVYDNSVFPIRICSMIEISETVKEKGVCNLNVNQLTLLDDVGTEPEMINHFGTKVTWFKDFIESYYLKGEGFNRLIITTNCGGTEIEAKYGYRVRSRLREMFNVITLKGEDMRGKTV